MATEVTELRKIELLDCFIENPKFYKPSEFGSVRNIIAENYFNNYELLERIGSSEQRRSLLSSSKLLLQILSEVAGGRFKLPSEETSEDFFFLLNLFNLHEDRFFSNPISIASLEFLTFIIQVINDDIVNTEKLDDYSVQIESLYTFFKRIVNKVNLQQANQGKYQALFNKIEQVFNFSNHKNASTWFKFYFYFRDKKKFNNNIESNVIANVSVFIRNSSQPKLLKVIIEEVLPIKEFTQSTNYLNEIYNKCRASNEFTVEFFSIFDDAKKQALLDLWLQKSSSQARYVIKGVNEIIPNKLDLGNKILARFAGLNNNLNEKKGFLELFFLLGLTKEEIVKTNFTNQIKNLVFNTNLNLHSFGINALQDYREFVDTKSLKTSAESFITSYLNNSNTYHKHIENIINSKLGLTTTFVDKHINSNPNILNTLNNYFVSSGNLSFYNALKSKLNQYTIDSLNERLINSISKKPIYSGILKTIQKENFEGLSDSAQEKLSLFLK